MTGVLADMVVHMRATGHQAQQDPGGWHCRECLTGFIGPAEGDENIPGKIPAPPLTSGNADSDIKGDH